MLFNPGDEVLVRTDLESYETYEMEGSGTGFLFVPEMNGLLGKQVTIFEYVPLEHDDNHHSDHYRIVDEYGEVNKFKWTDRMFVSLDEAELPDAESLDVLYDWVFQEVS